MPPFNPKVYFIVTLILLALIYSCWYSVKACELNQVNGWGILIPFGQLFYVLRFPTHTLMKGIFQGNGPVIFFVGLGLNCLLYGVVLERLVETFKNRHKE